MSRRRILALFAIASIGLAACGAADTTGTGADASPTASATPAATATETEPASEAASESGTDSGGDTATEADDAPAASGTAAPADDAAPPAAPEVEDEGPGTDTPPAAPAEDDGGPVAPVTLAFDGREVPVATSCAGVDGAILATTEGEVTISLVREHGVALRYQAEGTDAETDEVAVEGGTDTTTYRATLSSDDVPPVEVTMVVMDDATLALDDC